MPVGKTFPLDRNCFVTSVTLPFLRKFGAEALDWDPLIVREAFEGGFHTRKMPQRLFDKLNCGLGLIGTTSFTDTIEGFLTATAVMNNLVLDAVTAPFVTLEQCAWSVWEYINLNGDVDTESRPTESFSPDIVYYIQEVARLNGVFQLPVWLSFAQAPKNQLPDMSSDVDLFESFMARQIDYISDLNGFVQTKQAELQKELSILQKAGLVG